MCPKVVVPHARSISWTGNSQSSSCGHFFHSSDLDGSTTSPTAGHYWTSADCQTAGHPSQAEPSDAFPAACTLLPAGMLSPENTCPSGAACANVSYPLGTVSTPCAQQALQSLPLRARALESPKHSCVSQLSTQITHDVATACRSASPGRDDSLECPSSLHSSGSARTGNDGHVGDSLHSTRNTGSVSTMSRNTHDDGHSTWLAQPEVCSAIQDMLEEELTTAIDPDYMEYHSEAVMSEGLWVTPAMRLMTVNWMSEAVDDLDLDQVCTILVHVSYCFDCTSCSCDMAWR
jgi:hypothetical protein